MEAKNYPDFLPHRVLLKTWVNKGMLFALGRALQSLSNSDPLVQAEVSHWPPNFKLVLAIPPKGGHMSVQSVGAGRLRYLGGRIKPEEADVAILVKSVHSGFKMLTGQLGPDSAYAQHAMSAKGDLSYTVSVVRVLDIVEAYLFPAFMAKKLMKSLPPIPSWRKHLLRLKAYTLGILFGI
ncbi:MAG: hypothetical protein VB108_08820 [Anaerolineaceae bacterium]|nr:hypothetical protein [Anaerolineaceae bacterium]